MKTRLLVTTAAAVFAATMVLADAFADKIVADLQANGFDRIEIKVGPTQTKAEAIQGGTKIEVVYDNATGQIVKQETESAAGENIGVGVDIRTEDRDFVGGRRGGGDDDDEMDDNGGPRGDDDDDDDDDRGGNSGPGGGDDDEDDD